MSSESPQHVDLSLAKLLPSLPWSTDAVVKNPELLPEKLLHDYSYRLCDTLTWVYSSEVSGPVPIHIRRGYRSPDKGSFKHMDKVTTLLEGADHFLQMLNVSAAGGLETLQPSVDVVPAEIPSSLASLWGRFSIFNNTASATSILANFLVAAYYLGCLFEGNDDIKLPEDAHLSKQKLRLPLSMALYTSPLVLLSTHRWHTRDFHRGTLFGMWQCLGNDRPPVVAKIEKELWKILFMLAKGERQDDVALLLEVIQWAQKEIQGISQSDDEWLQEDIHLAVRTVPQANVLLLKPVPHWPEHHLPATFQQVLEIPEPMHVDHEEQISSNDAQDNDERGRGSDEEINLEDWIRGTHIMDEEQRDGAQMDEERGSNDAQSKMEDGGNSMNVGEKRGSDGAQIAQIRDEEGSGDAQMDGDGDGERDGERNGAQARNEEEDSDNEDEWVRDDHEMDGGNKPVEKAGTDDESGGGGDEDLEMQDLSGHERSKEPAQKKRVQRIEAIDESEEEEEVRMQTPPENSEPAHTGTNSTPPVNDTEEDVQLQATGQHPPSKNGQSSRKIKKFKQQHYLELNFEMPMAVRQDVSLEKHKAMSSEITIQQTEVHRFELPAMTLYGHNWDKHCSYIPSLCTPKSDFKQSEMDSAFLLNLADATKEHLLSQPSSDLSPFVTIQFDAFRDMPAEELQSLFTTKHILVKGVPHTKISFDRKGLSTLGAWNEHRTFQEIDLSIEPDANGFGCRVQTATLNDLHWHSLNKNGKILNGLEFPCPAGYMEPDVQISSDAIAWSSTTAKRLCTKPTQKPLTEIRWGLAGTAGAISRWHIDSNGLGTYIDVQTGCKWWVVASPKKDGPKPANRDFYTTFDPEAVNSHLWDVSAVILEPGDRLYMRPHTPHAVVTPVHSICFGGHFYSTGALKDTCHGILHTFVGSAQLTNADCRSSWELLHRLVVFYHQELVENGDDPDVDRAHLPNVLEQEGLVGLTLLCVIMELSNVLHPGTYGEESQDLKMHDLERLMLIDARKHSRLIMSWFTASYQVSNGTREDINVFEELLWQVAMTLAKAVQENNGEIHSFLPECTADTVAGALYDNLYSSPFVVNYFERRKWIRQSFDWEEGKLNISPRDKVNLPDEDEDGILEHDKDCLLGRNEQSWWLKIGMSQWMMEESCTKRRMESEADDDDDEPAGKKQIYPKLNNSLT
ncbi:hypothetical protein F5887DRAFT_926536 [Amanita rubescens]|nr:hypothetical protein F5887DRAFT_926536 [Amanita rubescens]